MNDKKDKIATINRILKNILSGKFNLLENELPYANRDETCILLGELYTKLKELHHYSIQLSNGNLSAPPPSRGNHFATGLKRIHAHLSHLVWQLSQVAQGDYEQVIDYMGEIAQGFNWMTQQLKLREAEIAYELDHDLLTGLLNRNAFKRKAHSQISLAPGKMGALLFSDLDNLKYVNDTFGHDIGDKYIIAAAEMFALFDNMGGLVSRISGDEFAIYIHGFDSHQDIKSLLFSFIDANFHRAIPTPDQKMHKIRTSIGIACYPQDADNINDLLKYADYAMYQAKKYNKGSTQEFNKDSYLKNIYIFEKMELLNKLIEEELVHFAFQPIVNLHNGSIYGYEALMRSKMEEFSSPAEILSVGEPQSKLYQIEKLTIKGVLEWVEANFDLLEDKKIFLNSLAGQLLKTSDLNYLKDRFSGLFSNVVFEIMESGTEDDKIVIQKADSVRKEFGSLVAIDDFCTGHSNNFRLLHLAPDIVKIDKSFIENLHSDQDKQNILSNIIAFCNSKNIKVLAEGVETSEELQSVVDLGFDLVQGYYFSKPSFTLNPIREDRLKSLFQIKNSKIML